MAQCPIKPRQLQALADALNLLRLMSSEKKSFDQINDLFRSVRWLHQVSVCGDFQLALAWVHRIAHRHRIQLNRNDSDEHPERAFRVYRGTFRPSEHSPFYQEAQDAVRKERRQAGRKAKRAADTLFNAFPWVKGQADQPPAAGSASGGADASGEAGLLRPPDEADPDALPPVQPPV